MKKVVVIGNGFIASHLKYEIVNCRLTPNENEIFSVIRSLRPNVVINATGFTGSPNVDQCESKKIATYTGNVIIPLMLAEACARVDVQMVHLGSGCIYFGQSQHKNHYLTEIPGNTINPADSNYFYGAFELADSGWKETDFANPLSYYSKTKYACDLALGQLPNVVTLRLRMPISPLNHPRNLLNKLIGYSKILEEPNSVTFTSDLVNAIDWAIQKEKRGIYHITSPKPLTHSVLLEEYKKYVPAHTYMKITKEELSGMVVATRSNCILDNSKAINEGFQFGDTDTNVQTCVQEFIKNRNQS